MHIHTISAYETSAEEFFKRLVDWKVDLVVDTRLKNTNQLAGFTTWPISSRSSSMPVMCTTSCSPRRPP